MIHSKCGTTNGHIGVYLFYELQGITVHVYLISEKQVITSFENNSMIETPRACITARSKMSLIELNHNEMDNLKINSIVLPIIT